jgi:hemoglobin
MESQQLKQHSGFYAPRSSQEGAGSAGIDRAVICRIVDAFYLQVAEDPMLGPVFNSRLHGEWSQHLQKMYNFWSTIILGQISYTGNPIKVHRELPDIRVEHFDRWLSIFRATLKQECSTREQEESLYGRAERMAQAMANEVKKDCARRVSY